MARTRATRRCFGLDVHRDFAQVAIWQNGVVTQAGTFPTTPEQVRAFADSLGPRDEVALEATGNAWAIATVLTSRAGRVVVSNPAKTRAIAEAKIKTDKVNAAILANLLAADYLPPVWLADADTAALRRQVLRRAHIVRQRTRPKNRVHAILHANLVPRCPAADLFGIKGRAWLAEQDLPADEHAAVSALLRQLDFHAEELRLIDRDLGQVALDRPQVRRLMTIPGVDATVALSIVAAVGDFTRFAPRRSWSATSVSTRECGNPVTSPPATAGSPKPVQRTPAACSSRPPGRRPKRRARCARSINGSVRDAACRSPSWPPPASSLCCAGT
jgi:transposase